MREIEFGGIAYCPKTGSSVDGRRIRPVCPAQWFIAVLCGWIQQEQADVISFLQEENRVLRAQLRGRRPRLSDDERRRLAVLGHRLGRAALAQVGTIAAADTILRWHRELAGRRCTNTRRRAGRPRAPPVVRKKSSCMRDTSRLASIGGRLDVAVNNQ